MPGDQIFPDSAREFLDDVPESAEPSRVISRTSPTLKLPSPNEEATEPSAVVAQPRERVVVERRGTSAMKIFGLSMGTVIGLIVGLALALVLSGWLVFRGLGMANPFQTKTEDRSGPAVITAIQNLKTFQAASGHYEIVVDIEKDVQNLPSSLAGERVLFIAVGEVAATVDFSGLGPGAVKTNADRTEATITLPAPTLGKAQLDLDKSYVAMHQRGLKERLQDAVGDSGSGVDTQEVYRVAQQKLTVAAQSNNDLRDRAEANTRSTLTALLGSLGYTKVTVVFEQEP